MIQVGAKGYGSGLLGGIRAARGLYVLMGDADGSYDFGELPKFLECLRAGKDLVVGCRLPKGGGKIEIGAMPWKHRWIGNPALSGIGKMMFQAPIDDFHCGLRAFKRQAVLDLDLRCTGMEFASEMIVKGVVAKLAFDQVPITLRPDGRSRPPHLRSWRDGWRHLRFMLLFSPKWLFFIPGATLFSLGTIGFISLMFGPLRVGVVTFDTNTLLICAAAMLVGFQLLFFAVFIKAFAVRAKLLRPDPRIDKILKAGPADWGGIVGMLLCVVGIGYLIMAIGFWQGKGFGPLPYAEGLRIVIPGVTAISLGAQCIFSGFALAIFDLPRRES